MLEKQLLLQILHPNKFIDFSNCEDEELNRRILEVLGSESIECEGYASNHHDLLSAVYHFDQEISSQEKADPIMTTSTITASGAFRSLPQQEKEEEEEGWSTEDDQMETDP
jgi:hypothetical protein